jgi:hypothetical protein
MTEEEAKTKWCPFVRPQLTPDETGTVVFDGRGLNESRAPLDTFHTCIGSACAAWRWFDPWTSQTEERVGGDIVLRLKRKPGEPKIGYCGLAGKL